jgi:hypothetical protein
VIRIGQQVVAQRDEDAEQDEQRGTGLPRKQQTEQRRAGGRGHDLPFALESIRDQREEERSQRIDHRDDEGVLEAAGDRDAL